MSMPGHRRVEESEPGALWPGLWVGAALVAMVMFTYWLNLM